MSKRRVVVTGMGIVSPLGNDLATSWDGIVNGRSGIGPITQASMPAEYADPKIAGEIRGFRPRPPGSNAEGCEEDGSTSSTTALAASLMAMDDAGLEVTEGERRAHRRASSAPASAASSASRKPR